MTKVGRIWNGFISKFTESNTVTLNTILSLYTPRRDLIFKKHKYRNICVQLYEPFTITGLFKIKFLYILFVFNYFEAANIKLRNLLPLNSIQA
jgi:hypothetical protein